MWEAEWRQLGVDPKNLRIGQVGQDGQVWVQ